MFIDLTTLQEPFGTMCFLEIRADCTPTGHIVKMLFFQVTPELAARTPNSISYHDEIEYDE